NRRYFMKQKVALIALVLIAAVAAAQAQEKYLDIFYVQIKPEKRAEFDAINKKFITANRNNQGDSWIGLETVYGTGGSVTFMSLRSSYADVDKASGAFYGALAKAYGKPGTDKLFQDFGQCVTSTRGELRRVRFDFSSNVSPDSLTKLLGETRWVRTTVVHLR